jgi:hypothetical protein
MCNLKFLKENGEKEEKGEKRKLEEADQPTSET